MTNQRKSIIVENQTPTTKTVSPYTKGQKPKKGLPYISLNKTESKKTLRSKKNSQDLKLEITENKIIKGLHDINISPNV